jgi:hypothetical protein
VRKNHEWHITQVFRYCGCLGGAFSKGPALEGTFTGAAEGALRSSKGGVIATIPEQPRNSNRCGELDKFRLANLTGVHRMKGWRKPLQLVGMRSDYQYHPGNFVSVLGGIKANVKSGH